MIFWIPSWTPIPFDSLTSSSASWDERYRQKPAPAERSGFLVELGHLLPARGRALDLACGGGRNSVFLAEHGLRAVGIDRSWHVLQQGRELAARRHVSVSWIQADLEKFLLPPAAFDVILCFYYRDPCLYAPICASLRPGGLLFYETYTREQLQLSEGPRNPAHLLEPAELLKAFGGWDLLFYRETWIERGVASLVARKPPER